MKIHAKKLLLNGCLTADRVVTVEAGRITAVDPGTAGDRSAELLTPGLFDVHIHGGEGFNAKDCGMEALRPFVRRLRRCGVTGFLLTISTAGRETMRRALALARTAMQEQAAGTLDGARILGVHLEGPFLSGGKPGAMPPADILRPDCAAFDDYFAGFEDIISLVTLAPEEPGAAALIAHLLGKGIRVQAGHTEATYDEAKQAFALGVSGLCHSFNACRPIHHREPGVVTAALEEPAVWTEAICDLVHLHPAILRLLCREKGPARMLTVSDSVYTHGLPDGEYHLEGYDLRVQDGIARTFGGALDGGNVYLDGAVRNLIAIGIPQEAALQMACETPYRRMGITDAGTIAPGCRALLTGWDEACRPVFTVTDGLLEEC